MADDLPTWVEGRSVFTSSKLWLEFSAIGMAKGIHWGEMGQLMFCSETLGWVNMKNQHGDGCNDRYFNLLESLMLRGGVKLIRGKM